MHCSRLLGLGALIGHLKKTIRDHTKKKEENKVSSKHSCLKHFFESFLGTPLNIHFFLIPKNTIGSFKCALKNVFILRFLT